jgi:glutamyl-tRNA reductase
MTCQRVEAYAWGPCACGAPVRLAGIEAVQHLAAVAAGLESAVPGEEQVLGQVRDALAETTGAMRTIGDVALASARQLRRTAGFAGETGDLLIRGLAVAGQAPSGTLLVLGGGQLGRSVARRAAAAGFARVVVASRTKPRWIDERFAFLHLNELEQLPEVDVIAGCIGSVGVEITLPPLPKAGLTVDLGTPRLVDPASAGRVITIADILDAGRPAAEAEHLAGASRTLRAIVARRFEQASHTAKGPLGRLRADVEQVRAREAERIRRLHPEIPGPTVDAITRSLVNQLFHLPSQRLQRHPDPDFDRRVAALFAAPEHAAP